MIERFKIRPFSENEFSGADIIMMKFKENPNAFYDHKMMKLFVTQQLLDSEGDA